MIPVLLLLLISAHANDSGVGTLDFNEKENASSSDRGPDRSIQECYVGLADGKHSYQHDSWVILDSQDRKLGRERHWRYAVAGDHQGQRGYYILGHNQSPMYAALPKAQKGLVRISIPGFATSTPFALFENGKISGFVDSLSVARTGLNARNSTPMTATPLKDSFGLNSLLMNRLRSMIPTVHARFVQVRAEKKGSEASSAYLDPLQICAQVPEPAFRQLVNEEIRKFVQ